MTAHTGPGQNLRFSDIVLDDDEISMAAKGVFATLGLLGDGCGVANLARRSKDTQEAVRAALDELVEAGYVEVQDERVYVTRPASFGLPG